MSRSVAIIAATFATPFTVVMNAAAMNPNQPQIDPTTGGVSID